MQPFADNHAKESNVRTVSLIVAGLAALFGAAHVAGQGTGSNVARSLAATCANCHGTNGVSVGEVASLAGRPKDETVRKMQDFKAGRVQGTIMPQLAKGYTDEQIDLVAAWFAAQRAN
jgi:sulfide dehydrogenase cytochrome subunit